MYILVCVALCMLARGSRVMNMGELVGPFGNLETRCGRISPPQPRCHIGRVQLRLSPHKAGMRVFWPKSGLKRVSGDVVGWRLRDTLCVVAIVEKWTEDLVQLDHPGTRRHPGGESSAESRKRPLSVIGQAEASSSTLKAEDDMDEPAVPRFWVDDRYLPIGFRYVGSCPWPRGRITQPYSSAAEVVLFDPPDPRRLRFFTLRTARPDDRASSPRQPLQSEMAKQDRYTFHRGAGELDQVIDCVSRALSVPWYGSYRAAQPRSRAASTPGEVYGHQFSVEVNAGLDYVDAQVALRDGYAAAATSGHRSPAAPLCLFVHGFRIYAREE